MLLIDAGNSRLKWALAGVSGLHSHGVAPTGAALPEALARTLAPQPVLIGSVAGDEHDRRLQEALSGAGCTPVHFARVASHAGGLRIAYSDPNKLGVDRWLAMLGARDTATGALCVADAGTALTVDAVTSDGHHLGGLIAPGTDTMMRAMLTDTARIGESAPIDALTDADFFARDTGAAVAAGAAFAAASLIDRAVDLLASRQAQPVTLLLTGGQAPALARLVKHEAIVVPDLVLRGLARVAQEGLPCA